MTKNPNLQGRRIVLMNTIRELEGRLRFFQAMERSPMSGLYPLDASASVERSLATAREELSTLRA